MDYTRQEIIKRVNRNTFGEPFIVEYVRFRQPAGSSITAQWQRLKGIVTSIDMQFSQVSGTYPSYKNQNLGVLVVNKQFPFAITKAAHNELEKQAKKGNKGKEPLALAVDVKTPDSLTEKLDKLIADVNQLKSAHGNRQNQQQTGKRTLTVQQGKPSGQKSHFQQNKKPKTSTVKEASSVAEINCQFCYKTHRYPEAECYVNPAVPIESIPEVSRAGAIHRRLLRFGPTGAKPK